MKKGFVLGFVAGLASVALGAFALILWADNSEVDREYH